MKVTLKRNIKSAKFNVTFPKGKSLNYSKELQAVEHHNCEGLYIRVEEKDFTIDK